MLRLSILGRTVKVRVIIDRDGGTETAAGRQSENRTGAERSRKAAIPDWLAGTRARALPGHRTRRDQLTADSFWALPRRDQLTADSFWAALNDAEQRDFLAVAQRRTFARGATLMREGEPADHVIVVLSGRTKICVHEDGRELLLAQRGPGQLIGERAALEVSVRSATVIALTTVQALAVPTERFADFVSTHSRVLDLVEGQVYARLTEGPELGIRPRRLKLVGENCTVVLTDVGGFGGLHRNADDRQIVRQTLYEMTRAFLDAIDGVCSCEDRGDGFLLVVPPLVPTSRVMECLLQDLPPRLRRHNHTYSAAVQIRLRLAVNVGPVVSDFMGVSGDAIINAARLVEAPVLKQSMLARHPNIGVIASPFVYETAIKAALDGADSGGYESVEVIGKESSFSAWMKLIDPDGSSRPLTGHGIRRAPGRFPRARPRRDRLQAPR